MHKHQAGKFIKGQIMIKNSKRKDGRVKSARIYR